MKSQVRRHEPIFDKPCDKMIAKWYGRASGRRVLGGVHDITSARCNGLTLPTKAT